MSTVYSKDITDQSTTDDGNTDNARKVEDAIKEADELYVDHKYEEIYALLSLYKHMEDAEVLWRLSRACCMWAAVEEEEGRLHRRKELMGEAFTFVQRALELDDNSSDIHIWYATMLYYQNEEDGLRARYNTSFLVREHAEKALSLNPKNVSALHALGCYYFEYANLSWYQRKVSELFFTTPPPVATNEQALEYLYKAEEVGPGLMLMNLVFAGKAHYHLGQYSKARELYTRVCQMTPKSASDRKAVAEAKELLKKMDDHHE